MSQEKIVGFIYLKVFLVVGILILVSALIVRIGSEINNSTYKNNSFSLLIVSRDSKLIFVDKRAKSALFLAVGDISKIVKGKNAFEASMALGIPINAMLVDRKAPINLKDFSTVGNELRLILGGDVTFKNLNRYDVFKLVNTIRSVNKDNAKTLRISLFDQEKIKENLDEAFTDSEIRRSFLTVEIDNGTAINGLGSILALILSKQGYNIIAVRTTPSEVESYIAFDGEKNLFISSLEQLLGFSVKKEQISESADVTIFLGDDVGDALSLN